MKKFDQKTRRGAMFKKNIQYIRKHEEPLSKTWYIYTINVFVPFQKIPKKNIV